MSVSCANFSEANRLPHLKYPATVVGVDVGAPRKGFHAVALRGEVYFRHVHMSDAGALVRWINDIRAQIVAVDAPCRWSMTGRARPAERALMSRGIWCFSTPTQQGAISHHKNHYGWMLAGAALFEALQPTHALYASDKLLPDTGVCFETFPHAIACVLSGKILSAKNKRKDRSSLLKRAGVVLPERASIDMIDAALCALVAHHFGEQRVKYYGDFESGLIVVPRIDEASGGG
jgi:predicted RNase H-like nuclease